MTTPALLRTFCLLPLVTVSPCHAAGSEHVEAAQTLVTKWAKIRQETIRIESEWETEKDLLGAMTNALESRRQALEEQKRSLSGRGLGQRNQLAELAEKNTAAKAGLSQAERQVRELGDELLRHRALLPPRLSRGLEMAFRSLAAPEAPIAERSQHVATILNRCAQFNRSITTGEEPVVPADGSGEKLIEVVYWGLSCAYGHDRTTGMAYVGRPETDGWVWREKPGIADAVERLIGQARDEADPAFVELPVKVRTLARD